MDVDAVTLTKLTPAEQACCIQEILCFRFHKPGHSTSQHNQSIPHPQNVHSTDNSASNPANPNSMPSATPIPTPVSAIEACVQILKAQGKDKTEVLQTLKLCYKDIPENVALVELEDF